MNQTELSTRIRKAKDRLAARQPKEVKPIVWVPATMGKVPAGFHGIILDIDPADLPPQEPWDGR